MERTEVLHKDRPAGPLQDQNIGFEDYLYNWAMFIDQEQRYTRDLTQAAVTMHVRSRGVTISDMVSGYGTRVETQGRWLQYDPNLDGEVHPINIVGPNLNTNKNACLQSNAATEVTSANASAKNKQIAMRWQKIADYFERTGWNESKRGIIFDNVQKSGTILIDTFLKEIDRQIITRITDEEKSIALYSCESCGEAGLTDAPKEVAITEGVDRSPENVTPPAVVDNDNDAESEPDGDADDLSTLGKAAMITCPDCGADAHAVITTDAMMRQGETDVPVYDIADSVIPFFNYAIDGYGAKTEGIQGAGWLQVQRLRDLMWMRSRFPNMAFTGPSQWSYALRCDYALSRGRWQYFNQQPRDGAFGWGHERYEVKEIYLHSDAYEAYRAPADFEFVDASGELTFRIKQGQTIGEAQKALFGEDQKGFKFLWHEQQLLTIPSPKTEEVNFRLRFSDVHWSRESGAYLSSPNYSIVYIQDDITLLNTLHHNIIARNAVNPVYYDSTVFEKADFTQEFIPTKNAALLADFDMRKAVTQMPVPTPSPYLSQQMQWLWEIKDTVIQVTPAMRGEAQKGSPFAAQRQQLEQSYGNLTSVLKSFAQCKNVTFLNKARLAKKFWTLEQFQRAGSMFGELWTEEDVDEMCAIDLDRDLIVSYREGSEMPATPLTKELKFFGALQQLVPLMQLAPGLLGTDKMTKLMQKIDEVGELDFDLTGLEVDELVAQKRFNDLARICAPYQEYGPDQIALLKTTVVHITPATPEAIQQSIQIAQSAPNDPNAIQQAQKLAAGTPVTAFDLKVEEIIHESKIQFSQYENLDQQKSFFTEMVRGEIGKTKPNYMLINIITTLLGMMTQAIAEVQNEAMMNNPQVQAAKKADEANAQLVAAQHELEVQKLQLENKKIEADLIKTKMQIEAGAEQKKADVVQGLLTQKAEHEHQIAKGPSESISFKDLPASGQVQLAEQAGINISEAEVKQHVKDSKPAPAPAPAAGKPKPKPKK